MKRKILSILLIVSLSLCLIALAGCGASTTEKKDAGADPTEQVESQDSGANAEATEPDQSAQVQSGELRYSGTSSAENIESISISFILSEDKTSIHGFTISVNGFQGTARITGATVSVEVSGQTQTMMNDIPVDYEGNNQNIAVGDSTIESLRFNEDGSADLVFTYCYKETAPQAYEIPVSGIQFEMTSEPGT